MKQVKKGLASLSFVFLGILMAFVGVSKVNEAEAAVNDIKERIAFGTKNSPVEVYFITDWFCPSCKKVEPLIEKIYPKIKSKVTFYFVDYPIHRKSINFTPYNLAFLVENKGEYFKARDALSDLADTTESPTEKDVRALAKQKGLNFKELSFLEIQAGLDYFDNISEKYHIKATPTIIIANSKNEKKFVKLEGRDEISESAILKGIDKVK